MPEERMTTLNFCRDTRWKYAELEYGSGMEAFQEVLHQLHSLEIIRQFTCLDYYEVPPPGFGRSPALTRTHVDHCTETLRLQSACAAAVTVIPVRLELSVPLGVTPEFSTRHMRRNYTKMLAWVEENVIPFI